MCGCVRALISFRIINRSIWISPALALETMVNSSLFRAYKEIYITITIIIRASTSRKERTVWKRLRDMQRSIVEGNNASGIAIRQMSCQSFFACRRLVNRPL